MGKRRSEQIMVHFYKGKRRETEVTEILWIYTCTCKQDMFTCTCKHDMFTCTVHVQYTHVCHGPLTKLVNISLPQMLKFIWTNFEPIKH